jgi:hypothetical protein
MSTTIANRQASRIADMRAVRVARRIGGLRPHRRGAAKDEAGAVIVLALIFLVLVGGVVGALATWSTNSLNNTTNFASARSLQAAATSVTRFAMQSIRYTPMLASGQTWNASPPQPCWGSGTTSQLTLAEGTSSETVAVWCSTVWNPTSLNTRVVTFYTCPATVSSTNCAASPTLEAVVTYNDYPPGTNEPTSAECSIYCGTSMTVNSWVYSL